MKINRETKTYKALTLRIAEVTMNKVDEVAEKNGLSRQKLIEAILEQVMADKKFVLHVRDR